MASHQKEAMTGWLQRSLAPLGVPVSIIADDPMLLEAACAGYDEWRTSDLADAPMIEIRLWLSAAAAGTARTSIRVEKERLTLSGGGIKGDADALTGRARCGVPADLLDNAPALRAEIVDPLLLFLLARRGRPPLHAAGVMLGDTALLLAGPSGVGKSTLALAAAAQGMAVLSDDTIHVQREPRLRVWGFSSPVHVFPNEAPRGTHPVRTQGGKCKAAVALPPALALRRHADRAVLIVLDRGERLALDPITADAARTRLMRLDAGFDLLPRQSAAAIAELAAGGPWRLALTDNPDAAITLLRVSLGRPGGGRGPRQDEQPGG